MNAGLKKASGVIVLLLAAALVWHWMKADTAQPVTKEYVVAQDGSGDFRTIQEAVDNAADGETIRIYPGTYYENVTVLDKGLNLIGTDKDECEIQYDTASYLCVPLEIAAGKVSNLTIYGIHGREEGLLPEEMERIVNRYGEEAAMEVIERVKGYSGYAVHADQNSSYGKELLIENCRIISENSACVGMGGRGGEKITFKDCELLSAGTMPCIFLHDSAEPELAGEIRFEMHDCILEMENDETVLWFATMLDRENSYVFDFRNVTANVSDAVDDQCPLTIKNFGTDSGDGWCGLNNTMLTKDSQGNTINVMNWDESRLSAYEKTQLSVQ